MSQWPLVRAFLLGYGSAFGVAMIFLMVSRLADWPSLMESAPLAWTIVGVHVGVSAGFKAGTRWTGGRPPQA